jgi:hypothetical protein
VQIVKHRQGNQLAAVAVAKAHGSWRRIQQALDELGYQVPNTSTVERFNATARRMNAHQVRRSLAFAHRPQTRKALASWSMDSIQLGAPPSQSAAKAGGSRGKTALSARTPAMALGLTQRIWSEADVLRTPVYP